jgi:autotransporter-associated beta strand protein
MHLVKQPGSSKKRPGRKSLGNTLRRAKVAIASAASAAMLFNNSAPSARAADTVITFNNGQTDLTNSANYTGGTLSTTSDIQFSGTYSPTAFTVNTGINPATLNDLSATAITIDNTSGVADAITLQGGSDAVVGSAATDLLFVGTGASLNIGSTSNATMNLALGTSGNFDIVGSATIGSSSNITGTNTTITKTGAGTLTINSAIQTGTGGLTISAGAVTLNGANSAANWTGAVSLANGTTLTFGSTSALTASNAVTLSAGTATLATGGFANTILSLTMAAPAANETLTITGAGVVSTSSSASSVVFGTGAGIVLITGGTINLGPSGTVDATTIVNNNANTRTVASALLGSNVNLKSGNLVNGGGLVTFSGNNTGLTGVVNLTGEVSFGSQNAASNQQLVINATNAGILANVSLVLTNAISLANTAQFREYGSQTLQLNGIVSGTGGLSNIDSGILFLNGANTFTGKVVISNLNNAPTIKVTSLNSVNGGTPLLASSSLGAPTTIANGTIDIAAGTLLYAGTGETTDRVINLAGTTTGGTIDQSGTGLLKFTSNFTATGNGIKTLTLQGSTTGTGEIDGAIVNSTSATSVSKAGTGTWTLAGLSAYTGTTNITNGTLSINTIASFSTSSAIGAPVSGSMAMGSVATTGTLTYTGAQVITNRTIQIGVNSATPAATDTGGATIENDGSGALTFSAGTFNTQTNAATGVGANRILTLQGSNANANTISGAIQDNLKSGTATGTTTVGVTKTQAGTWILGGTNTYTGATTVTAGTLAINGSTAAGSAFTISGVAGNNATLTGTGIINGAVSLATGTAFTGAVINPGTVGTAGTLTLAGGLTANAFARLNFDLATGQTVGGGTNDLIVLGTAPPVFSAASTQVNINALGTLTLGAYTLINGYTGTIANIGNLSAGTITGDPTHSIGSFINSNGALQVVITNATPSTAFWSDAQADGTWNTINLSNSTTNWNTDATSGIDTFALPGSTTTVHFSTTTTPPASTVTTLGQAFSILGLVFDASQGATPISIAGSTLTIGTGGITVSGGIPTITSTIALGGLQSWTNSTANPLTVAAVTNGANTVTLLGTGNFAQTGVWGNGAGGIILDPTYSGTLTLNQANTFTGTLAINAGTVIGTSAAGALGAGALSLGGGTLKLTNPSGTNLSFGRNTTVTTSSGITSDVTVASTAGNTYTLGTLSIGAQTLTVAGGSNVSSGTAGITFGAVTLTNAPTFTVNNPAGGGVTLLTLGAVTNSTFTPIINGSGNVAQTGVWGAGSGGITYSGSGVLTLSQANTFTGVVTINSGTVAANGNAGALGTGVATLTLAGGTLDFNNSVLLSFSRNTSVTADSFITTEKNAAGAGVAYTLGTLAIGTNNLTVNGGNVTSGTAGVTFGAVTQSGNSTFTVNNPSGGGTTLLTLASDSGTATNLTFAGTGNTTVSGVIATTSGNVLVNGTGTNVVTFSSALNTYTGTTTVQSGTLSVGNVLVAAGASGLGNATSNIFLGGSGTLGLLSYTGGAITMTRPFTVNTGGGEIDATAALLTITPASGTVITASGPVTFGGANSITVGSATYASILITGATAINKVGAGTATLSTLLGTADITNAATPINILAGTLTLTETGTAGPSSNILGTGTITITPGATFNTNAGGGVSILTLANPITIAPGSATATVSGNTGGLVDNQAITFAAGSTALTILKFSDGNTTAGLDSYGGTISGTGTIQINSAGAAGSPITLGGAQNQIGSISNVGTAGTTSQTTLSGVIGSGITAINQQGANPFMVISPGGVPLSATMNSFTSTGAGLWTFTTGFNGAQPLTLNANSTGGITVSGTAISNGGNVTLSASNTGSITISAPITSTGALLNNGATAAGVYNVTAISGNISNVNTVTENSVGSQLILSGTNTYTGGATITNGLLEFVTTAAMPNYATTPSVTWASGTLALGYGTGAGQFTSANVASILAGTFSGITGPSNATGASIGFDTTAANASYTNAIANPGSTTTFGLVKLGANTLTLSTANTYTGATWIQNGTLVVGSLNNVTSPGPLASSSLGVPNSVASGTISLGFLANTGTLSYTGGGETTDRIINLPGTTGGGAIDQSGTGLLKFTGNMTFTGTGAKTLTLSGSTAGTGEYSGNIVGGVLASASPLTITKAGTGTWTLSGTGNTALALNVAGVLDIGANGINVNDGGGNAIQGTANATINATGGGILNISFGSATDGGNNGAANGTTLTINAKISMAGPFENFVVANGTGVTVLTAQNTYAGNTIINSGVLSVASVGNQLSVTSNLGAGTSILIANALSTLRYTGTGETSNRIINLQGTTTGGIIDQSGPSGTLTFSANFPTPGGGAKILTLQGSTAGTGVIAGIIPDSGAFTTGVLKQGTGTWTLSGANTYTGTTTASGGNLILSQGAAGTGILGDTAITINSGGTLSPLSGTLVAGAGYFAGNASTPAKGATLTLNSGGTLNLADGAIGNFILNAGTGFIGSEATFAGGTLKFDVGGITSDSVNVQLNTVPGAGAATSSGANAIVINPIATITGTTFTLISATGLTPGAFFLASPTVTFGGTTYNLSLTTSTSTAEILTVSTGGGAVNPTFTYWNGTTNSSWAFQAGGGNTNWAQGLSGSPDSLALPGTTGAAGTGTNVIFTTTNSATNPGGNSTTLDAIFLINSLTFNSSDTGSTIANGTGGPFTLRIDAGTANGNTLGNGITVQAGSGANTISAAVALGSAQTWTNSSSNPLTVSGIVSESSPGTALTLTGSATGTIVLNGANTFTGTVNITGGTTVKATSFGSIATAGGLGQSASTVNLGTTTTGSTLVYTGTGETSTHVINLASTTGGNTLDDSGTGTLILSSSLTTTGVGAKTLTLQGSTAGIGQLGAIVDSTSGATTLLKQGTGAWTLAGANTYTGNTTVSGGVLNIAGSLTGNGVAGSGSTLSIGNVAGNSVANITGNISTYFGFSGAGVSGANSVYNQTSGTVAFTNTGASDTINAVNRIAGGYGYFNLTGGSITTAGRFDIAATGGTGVAYVGGTGTLNDTADWLIIGPYTTATGVGELTVGPGGTVNHVGGNSPVGLNMNISNSYGVLNVAGGTVLTSTHSLSFGNGTGAGATNTVGILNLDAGSLSTGVVFLNGNTGAGSTGNGYLNFAGGKLVTTAAVAAVIPASVATQTITSTIFGPINNTAATGNATQNFTGGLAVDTGTFTSTLTNILNGATGLGVTQGDLSLTGGTGYIGAPAVQFLGGTLSTNGSPASGYALISVGVVTGIVITSPGEYVTGPTSVTLTGGGGTGASATIGTLATTNANTGGLTKQGAGTLSVTGSNTFAGVVDIQGGLLTTTLLANGGSPSGIGQSSNAAGNVLLDSSTATTALASGGGILGYSGTAAGTTDRNFTLNNLSGGFDASGTTLGTLTLTSGNVINVTNGLTSATLVLQGTGSGATGGGSIGSLIADGITNTQVGLAKFGTGTWTITNNSNTYTGPNILGGGTLSVSTLPLAGGGGTPSPLGAASNALTNLTLSGGTLQYTGTTPVTSDRNFTFGASGAAVGGGFDSEGTTAGASMTITGGMTTANTAAGTAVLALTANTTSGANSYNTNIVDSSGTSLTGVTKAGAGAWTLAGANTYSGATIVTAGTLTITGTNVPATAGSNTLNTTGTLNINSSGTVAVSTVTTNNGSLINLNSGTLLGSGNWTNTATSTLSFNGGTLKSAAPITIGANLGINVQAGGGTIDTTGGNITNTSALANTASPGTLNVTGGNTLQTPLSATMTGPVNVTGNLTTLKLVTTAGAVYPGLWTVGTGATVDINNLGNFSFGGLTGGGNIVNTGASAVRTVTITGTGGNTFSGSIQQPTPSTTLATGVTITLATPTATQTFSGTHTYGGPTQVTAGTLVLTSTAVLANTAITVSNGATLSALAGSGTITAGNNLTAGQGATLTLAAGSTFNMVDGLIGTFAVTQNSSMTGAIFTLAGATLNLELDGTTAADQIIVSGATAGTGTVTGTNTVNVTLLAQPAGPYTIVTAPGIAVSNTAFKFGNGTATESLVFGPSTYNLTLQSTTTGVEQIVVSGTSTNVTWVGLTGGAPGTPDSTWGNAAGNSNFASGNTPTDYVDGQAVTFGDTDAVNGGTVSNTVVTIASVGVQPGAVTFNNSIVNYTVSTAGAVGIAGATGVTKTGSGTVTLSSVNTYSGPTAINGGILNIGIGTALGSGSIAFGGGTLQYGTGVTTDLSNRFSTASGNLISIDTNNNNVTFATALTSPSGTLTKNGAGTLTLPTAVGTDTYSGATIINGGTLKVTGNNAAGSAAGVLAGTPTITINNGGTLLILNTLALSSDTLGFTAGKEQFIINSGGTLTNNSTSNRQTVLNTIQMTGGTISGTSLGDGNSGAFSLAATPAVIATSDASGNPATISANVSTQTVDVFQVTRGTGPIAAGAPDLIISGPITPYGASTNGITIKGSGIVTLSGLNTYKGNTTILGGSLGGIVNANSTQALGNNTAALILGDTTGNFGILNVNQNNSVTALNVSTSTTVVNTNVNTIAIASGKTLTNTGAVTIGAGAATTNFTALTVTGNAWTIGTLGTPTGAGVTLGLNATTNLSNGATLDLTGLSTFSAFLGIGTFLVGESANTGGTGTAASTLKLAPTSSITAATLSTDSSDGGVTEAILLGTGTNTINANTINIGMSANRASGSLTFLTNSGSLSLSSEIPTANTAVFNDGYAATAGTGFNANSNLVDLTGHNATLSLASLNIGGRLAATAAGAVAVFKFDNGTIDSTAVTVGGRGGTTAGTTSTSGDLQLSGGITTIRAGGLNIGINSATVITPVTGSVELSGNAIVTVGATSNVAVTLGKSATASATSSASLSIGGTSSLTLAGDLIKGTGAGSASVTSALTLSGGTLNMGGFTIGSGGASSGLAINTFTLQSGTLQNLFQFNSGADLVKTTVGTLILAGTNSYTGGTQIQNGILKNGSATALPSTSTVTIGSIGNSGTFDLNGFNAAIGGLATAGTASSQSITNSGASNVALTVGGAGTFGGVISDGGTNTTALTKTGAVGSTLVLSGTNTYSGATSIQNGIMLANNTTGSATGTSAVSVSTNATLAGTGNITGLVTVAGGTLSNTNAAGGIIGAGNAGVSVTGNLTLAGGLSLAPGGTTSTYKWGFTTPSTYDTLTINTLSIGTGSTVDLLPVVVGTLSGFSNQAAGPQSFEIIHGSVAQDTQSLLASQFYLDVPSLAAFTSEINAVPGSITFSGDPNGDVFINYNAAPEPTSMMLLGLGVGGLAMRRRRRKLVDAAK